MSFWTHFSMMKAHLVERGSFSLYYSPLSRLTIIRNLNGLKSVFGADREQGVAPRFLALVMAGQSTMTPLLAGARCTIFKWYAVDLLTVKMGISDATRHISIPYLDLTANKGLPSIPVSQKELPYPLYHGALVPKDSEASLLSVSETKNAPDIKTSPENVVGNSVYSDALMSKYDDSLFLPAKSDLPVLEADSAGNISRSTSTNPVALTHSRNIESSRISTNVRRSRLSNIPGPIDPTNTANFKPSQSSPTLANMADHDYKRRLSVTNIKDDTEKNASDGTYLSPNINPISINAPKSKHRHQKSSSFTESFRVS